MRRRLPMAELAPRSAVIWRGESLLEPAAPIVAIATGLGADRSSNSKTGDMVQTWILSAVQHPAEAIASGADRAICGDCPHRRQPNGSRSCYVSLATGLGAVGRQLVAGRYPEISLTTAAAACAGRVVRLGAYGDPAAVPAEIWIELLHRSAGWTGYTHAWRRADRRLRPIVMASVDDPIEQIWARAEGWRTFRVRRVAADGTAEPLRLGEIACPASAEAGHRTTCADCQLCDGARATDGRRSIAIVDHSAAARGRLQRAARQLGANCG
jgi:hypothetical protein